MRQWLSITAAGAVFLAAIPPADARGAAGFRMGGGRAFAHPAVAPAIAGRRVEAFRQGRHFGRPFRFGQHGWAFASGLGYGVPWGDGSYDPTDPGLPAEPPEGLPPPPPPWLYGYGLPPQHVCFKPRLITIGKAAPKSHLPKVVYGEPPEDCKGS